MLPFSPADAAAFGATFRNIISRNSTTCGVWRRLLARIDPPCVCIEQFVFAAARPARYLRASGLAPDVPIFLAEGLPFGRNWAVPDSAALQAQDNAYLAAAYATLVAGGGDGDADGIAGDSRVYYVNTSSLFGPDAARDSGTTAGLHASDRGMHDMAVFWAKVLAEVLKA
jgi:hypothetical protein